MLTGKSRINIILSLVAVALVTVTAFQNCSSGSSFHLEPGAVKTSGAARHSPKSYCHLTESELNALTEQLGYEVGGFACNVTGGLGGQLCIVNSDIDNPANPLPGTLRFCVERAETPVVVKFDPALTAKKIRLLNPLSFRSNVTLDGRLPSGLSPVVITNNPTPALNPCHPANSNYFPQSPVCENPGLLPNYFGQQARYVWANNLGSSGIMFNLQLEGDKPVSNVIITDVRFSASLPAQMPESLTDKTGLSAFANPCSTANLSSKLGGLFPPAYVVGCAGAINIGLVDPQALPVRNIAIAHNEFSYCGDKCILGNGASDGVSVFGNYFHDSYFSVLVTNSSAYNLTDQSPAPEGFITAPQTRYSFYENRFERVQRRNPRCGSFVWCHVYNNAIGAWGSAAQAGLGISGNGGAQIYAEANFFYPPTSYSYSILRTALGDPYSNGNPAIENDNDVFNGPSDTPRGPAHIFNPSWALVYNNIVIPPRLGHLYAGPYPLTDNPAHVFLPSRFYFYESAPLNQTSFDAIKAAAGRRPAP